MEDLSEIEQLINGGPSGLTEAFFTDLISQMFLWILLPSILISVVILVLYIVHSIRRRKLEDALFEIRDILRDIQQQTRPLPIQNNSINDSTAQVNQPQTDQNTVA